MAVKHCCDRCSIEIDSFSFSRNIPFIKPDEKFRLETYMRVQGEGGNWEQAELCEDCYNALVLKAFKTL